MRPIRLKLRGAIGIWQGMGLDEIEVDFTRFDRGLVAFVGDNGSGKSTTIENLHPYLQLASQKGALSNHFRLRDSYRDLTVEFCGKTYRCHVLIDAQTGKTEAYLYEGDQALNDGKVTTYEEQVERIFGSADLFFRSVFCAQKRESIVETTPAKRKELFYELLNLQQYESFAEHAKAKADEIELLIAEKRGRLNQLEEELARRATLENSIAMHLPDIATREAEIEQMNAELAKQRDLLVEAEKALVEVAHLKTQEREISERYTAQLAELEKDEQKVKAETLTIAQAMERSQRILGNRALISEKLATLATLEAEAETLATKSAERNARMSDLLTYRLQVQEAKSKADQENAKRSETIAALKMKVEASDRTLERTNDEYKAKADILRRDIERNQQTAGLLDTVPCRSIGGGISESCKLLGAAFKAKDTISDEQAKLEALEKERAEKAAALTEECEQRRRELRVAEESAISQPPPSDESPYLAQIAAIGYNQQRHEEVRQLVAKLKMEGWENLQREADTAESAVAEKRQQLSKLDESLTEIQAKRSAMKTERDTELLVISNRIETVAAHDNTANIRVEIAKTESSIKVIEGIVATLRAALQSRRDELSRLDGYAKEKEAVEEEVTSKMQEVEAWRTVQRGCSKDGIPALEIDNSGVEVSRLANELLANAFGTEFQIQFDTLKTTKDKKKQVETFEIKVLRGDGEQRVESLSGGEKVWIDKAIQEAVAIYMSQKSERTFQTSYNDEADGALSAEKKQKYLDMLRQSFALGNRKLSIVISHSAEVWQQIPQRVHFQKKRGLEYVG